MLGIDKPFLVGLADVVREVMGDAYPQLHDERDTIAKWAAAEEEGFSRTLAQGEKLLREVIKRAKERGDVLGLRRGRVQAPRHLRLPLRADEGAARRRGPRGGRPGLRGADGRGAQDRARRACADAGDGGHDRVTAFARKTGFETRFVGYEATEWETVIRARRARERPRAGEARGEPVLRGGRRPGVGLRRGGDRLRPRGGRGRLPAGRRPGGGARVGRRASSGEGQRARRRRRPRDSLRDDVQPHGHPPAARRAAPAARHARPPGGLVRRPGQAALRLHARRAAVASRSSRRSRTR